VSHGLQSWARSNIWQDAANDVSRWPRKEAASALGTLGEMECIAQEVIGAQFTYRTQQRASEETCVRG